MSQFQCPDCKSGTLTVDVRYSKDRSYCRRRRRCTNCGNRFGTIEAVGDAGHVRTLLEATTKIERIATGAIQKVRKHWIPIS